MRWLSAKIQVPRQDLAILGRSSESYVVSLVVNGLVLLAVLGGAAALALLNVTVVLLDDGYASTALMPIEVFHSAGALWRELKAELEAPSAAPKMRLAAYARSWLLAREPGLKPSVAAKYANDLDHHILPALGDFFVDALPEGDLFALGRVAVEDGLGAVGEQLGDLVVRQAPVTVATADTNRSVRPSASR